jgi:hypothetical protein
LEVVCSKSFLALILAKENADTLAFDSDFKSVKFSCFGFSIVISVAFWVVFVSTSTACTGLLSTIVLLKKEGGIM